MILHSTTLGLPNCPIEIHYSIMGSSKPVQAIKIQGCWLGTQELDFYILPEATQEAILTAVQDHLKGTS